MREQVLEREQFIPLPIEEAYAPFGAVSNLQAITPGWLHFRILSDPNAELEEGSVIEYRLRLHGFPIRWRTVIESWDPPHRFTDIQVKGPFALWHHTHTFEAVEGGTMVRDRVRYRIGFGPIGDLAHRLLVKRDLERIFDYRREAVPKLLADAAAAG
jgi:ligand-binding SRPBCC domain-containing protein